MARVAGRVNINVHAHLFTLRTILTREAIQVMVQRLRDNRWNDFIVEAIEKLLDDLLDHPENLNERELLGRLVKKLLATAGFQNFLNTQLAGTPIAITLHASDVESLPVDVLRQVIDKITTHFEDPAKPGKSVFDIVEALRLAMRPTITDVADALLEPMEPGDALVALMMDIYGPDAPVRDRRNFLNQIAGTEEAALQRPGRVLPFFGLHPDRVDHFELMRDAIENRGFVGVKLYPSLGYEVGHENMLAVYRYCLVQDVPILLHCGHGGFYRQKLFIDYCDPRHWLPVLTGDLAALRVCFAHFGGWQSLGRPDGLDPGTWGATILQLMKGLPNVYTDLAYHTDQMGNPADEQHYFDKLRELVTTPGLERRILFGTDAWLLRMDMADVVYWNYYRQHAGDLFDVIAGSAPRAFLGFPERPGDRLRLNLQRYVDHMRIHRGSVGAAPAPWLQAAVAQTFDITRDAPDWGPQRTAARLVYQALGSRMSDAQKRKGYRVNRTLPLRELDYYRPHDPNYDVICEDVARKLLQFARQAGDYRAGYDDTSAVKVFTDLFRKAEKGLVDVAVLLDSVLALDMAIA